MRFLVIKTSALGDIIHAFTALSFLHKKFPHAEIDWVVEAPYAQLLESHPSITNVFKVETKKWRKGKNLHSLWPFLKSVRKNTYDAVFDLQGNTKSGLICACTHAKERVGFSWKTLPEWPNGLFTNRKFAPPSGKNVRADYLYLIQSYCEDFSPFFETEVLFNSKMNARVKELSSQHTFSILVHPGSAWRNKEIGLEALADGLKKIEREKEVRFLFAYGSAHEKELSTHLHALFPTSILVEPLPLPQLQLLMQNVQLVIAMDSLPLHLAGTTKTPVLSFFGPSAAEKYMPLSKRGSYIQGKCPYNVSFEKRCPKLRTCETGACIKGITGEEIYARFLKMK